LSARPSPERNHIGQGSLRLFFFLRRRRAASRPKKPQLSSARSTWQKTMRHFFFPLRKRMLLFSDRPFFSLSLLDRDLVPFFSLGPDRAGLFWFFCFGLGIKPLSNFFFRTAVRIPSPRREGSPFFWKSFLPFLFYCPTEPRDPPSTTERIFSQRPFLGHHRRRFSDMRAQLSNPFLFLLMRRIEEFLSLSS